MAKGGSGIEKRLEAVMPKDAPPNGDAPTDDDLIGDVRWGRGGGYRRCRPSFTVGRWPILAAGSTTCSTSCTTRPR